MALNNTLEPITLIDIIELFPKNYRIHILFKGT